MCVCTNVCWNKQIVMVGLTCTPLQPCGSHNFHIILYIIYMYIYIYIYIYDYIQHNYVHITIMIYN